MIYGSKSVYSIHGTSSFFFCMVPMVNLMMNNMVVNGEYLLLVESLGV